MNKIITLEQIKELSIDEIVALYKEGYTIEAMQYSTYCSGSVVLDKQNTSAPTDGNFQINHAFAQKVKPTSKCLKDVTLKLSRYLPNDMWVEIRKNDPSTDLPIGDPQTSGSLGSYTIPYTSILQYPSFGDVTIPINVVLSDSDITNGIWIVVCLYVYDPTSTIPDTSAATKTGTSGTVAEHMAFKSGTLPWQGNNIWNLYFKTSKQTYAVPCPTPIVSITCPTSIAKGSSGNIVATITTAGTPNYTYKLYRDSEATPIDTFGPTVDTSHTFTHTFNETVGNHTFKVDITDNCSTPKTVPSNICTVEITTPIPVFTSIEVSPSSITLSPGSIRTFLATCKDQFTNTITCPTSPPIVWSVDNTSIGTITQAGAFTAIAEGTTTIRATSGTIVGTASVTVSGIAPIFTSITISPPTASVAIGDTGQFTATCKDQFTNTMTCPTSPPIVWSVDNTSIGTISQTGLFSALSAGTTTIRTTSGTIVGTASVTVTGAPPAIGTTGIVLIAAVAIAAAYLVTRKR